MDVVPKKNTKISLCVILPASVDVETFVEQLDEEGIEHHAERGGLEGVVYFPASIEDVQNPAQFQDLIMPSFRSAADSIQLTETVRNSLTRTKYFQKVMNYIERKRKEITSEGVTKKQCVEDLINKYGHILGTDGCKKIADVYFQKSESIEDSYFSLQEYLLRQFSTQFFIEKIMPEGFMWIVEIHDNEFNYRSVEELKIKNLATSPLKRKSLSLPLEGRVDNLYISDSGQLIAIPNMTAYESTFIRRIGHIRVAAYSIQILDFLLKKDSEIFSEKLQNIQKSLERLQGDIQQLSKKELQEWSENVERLRQVFITYQDDVIADQRRMADALHRKRRDIDQDVFSDLFKVEPQFDTERVGVYSQTPPQWLRKYQPSLQIEKFKKSVISLNSTLSSIIKLLGEMRTILNQAIEEKGAKRIKLLNSFLELLNNVLSLVNKLGPPI